MHLGVPIGVGDVVKGCTCGYKTGKQNRMITMFKRMFWVIVSFDLKLSRAQARARDRDVRRQDCMTKGIVTWRERVMTKGIEQASRRRRRQV